MKLITYQLIIEFLHGRNNFSFARLDGTLNLQQRERVIKEFYEDRGILVFLLLLESTPF
jgi:SNF2 family DNA or RNA helicase